MTMTASDATPTPRVTLYHATAPTCWWSWGYEPVLRRVRAVYGDQVEVRVALGCPWTDLQEYYKHYGLDFQGVLEWQEEAAQLVRLPLHRYKDESELPHTLWPATQAAAAALRQGEARGERFVRELLRRFCAEGQDVTREDALEEAARASGLDVARFWADYEDGRALKHEIDAAYRGFPHVGFYNLALRDGNGRTVTLDHAFDPRVVEQAIDYLTGGALVKRQPRDLAAYVGEAGVVPEVELALAFALPQEDVRGRLEALAKAGRVERVTLAGAPAWRPAS